MKKSLVALAALAVVGIASAQSSVTMYGVADVSIMDSNAAGVKTQMSSSGAMNNGNSRFGFKGTEDLGGGLKANFNMEGGLSSETGAGNTSGGNLFSRAAWLQLAGDFGSVKMGRTLTPSFYGVAVWELTGTANYSVVAQMFGFANAGARNSSEFSYTTPRMAGFQGTAGYIFEADNGGHAKLDGNITYVDGPIAIGFSANNVKTMGKNYTLGGKYDFGMFAVAASYNDTTNGPLKGFTLGGSANLGVVALTLDVARDTGSAVKSTDYVVEAKYPLSKRTFAYGAVLRDGSASINSYGLGLRHNF